MPVNNQTGHQPASLPIFPDIPTTLDPVMQGVLQDMVSWMAATAQTFNTPGLVTNVTATTDEQATVLSWNATKFATQYRIYRNATGDFETASIVQAVAASKTGVATLTWQDKNDPENPTRYYWITGVNERQQEGPRSAMVTVNASATSSFTKTLADGVATGLFNLNIDGDTEMAGGIIQYTITVDSGSNMQANSGVVAYNAFNNDGVLSTATFVIGSVETLTTGSLVITWAFAATGPGPELRVTANSSLNFDPTIYYTVTNNSDRLLSIV